MKKYNQRIYVVTRIVDNEPEGMKSIPNLGVDTSLKRTRSHFKSVLESRLKEGSKLVWHEKEFVQEVQGKRGTYERARINNSDGSTEELRLELWLS